MKRRGRVRLFRVGGPLLVTSAPEGRVAIQFQHLSPHGRPRTPIEISIRPATLLALLRAIHHHAAHETAKSDKRIGDETVRRDLAADVATEAEAAFNTLAAPPSNQEGS